MALDRRLRVIPAAAAWWWRSPDGLRYTFHLRKGLRFSDGSRITAQDVVSSFDRALTSIGSNGIMAGYLSEVATVGGRPAIFAAGPARVTFQLNQPSPAFLSKLAFVGAAVVDMARVRRFGPVWTSHPVSSGPYRLLASSDANEIRLQRNPYFRPTPPFTSVNIRLASQQQGIRAFTRGQAAVVSNLAQVASLRSQQLAGLEIVPELSLDYVLLNVRRWPLNDRGIRRALSLVVDRPRLVKYAFHGDAAPESGMVPSPLLPRESRQRLDTAMALFAMGGSGHPFGSGLRPLRLVYPSSEPDRILAAAITRRWRTSIGLHVTPVPLSPGLYQFAVRTHHFDLALVRWKAETADAQDFLGDQLVGGAPQNFSGWANGSFDRLMRASLLQSIDSWARRRELLAAEAIAAREAPWIPLDTPLQAALIRPGLLGVALTPQGISVQ
ncbi:MAG TPA: ABC transporter substrate-binding protein [Chloroflexota bacterium]|nr:ABC transporter substrate-binding protein [Chloroflexota bacterium]